MQPILLTPHRIAEPRRVIAVVAARFQLEPARVRRAVNRIRFNGVDWEGEAAFLRKAFRAAIRQRHMKR